MDDLEYEDSDEAFILDAKYEGVSAREVADKQQHLLEDEKEKLVQVLEKYPVLFDGKLGHYPHSQVHLELEPNSIPVHSRPYAVPKAHEEVFKKELEHLVSIGVLQPCGPTEWASPTFIIPKKDG